MRGWNWDAISVVIAIMIGVALVGWVIWWMVQPMPRRVWALFVTPAYVIRCDPSASGQLTVVKLDDASIYVTC